MGLALASDPISFLWRISCRIAVTKSVSLLKSADFASPSGAASGSSGGEGTLYRKDVGGLALLAVQCALRRYSHSPCCFDPFGCFLVGGVGLHASSAVLAISSRRRARVIEAGVVERPDRVKDRLAQRVGGTLNARIAALTAELAALKA
jgi:hypothetical protein